MNVQQTIEPRLVYSSAPEGQHPVLTLFSLCFNTGRYLTETLASLAPQLTDEVEHIILDDASSDDSLDVLIDCARSTSYPVRIYANPTNCGLTESNARVIRLAKGEFLASCDDDLCLPHRIEHDLRIIRHLPETAAGYYSRVLRFHMDENGAKQCAEKPFGEPDDVHEQTLLNSTFLLDMLRKGNHIPAISVGLRKSVYEAFPQDTSYFIEDYPMWVKLAQAGWGLVFSPDTTMLYRRQAHTVQNTHSIQVDFDVVRVKMELLHIRLSEFNLKEKKRWFRVVCAADETMLQRLWELCKRTGNKPGILLTLSKSGWSQRMRWIFSNQSLKYHFWKHL